MESAPAQLSYDAIYRVIHAGLFDASGNKKRRGYPEIIAKLPLMACQQRDWQSSDQNGKTI
jgi:hypothetical protein